ncbi:MAG: PQQ-like beta-propeller repeat protein [Anaerolineales bacterium]|nr:PQQ-like beta-propeller repeat protein [Anaerolineales bacterium]
MKHILARHRLVGLLLGLIVLALSLSGCAGGALTTSWTGLTVEDDSVYAADLQQIVRLDAATGDVVWAFPADPKEDKRGSFYVTPAVGEGYVIGAADVPAGGFFGSAQHTVWALDMEGQPVWSFSDAQGQYVEGGAIGDGVFVIGNSDGNVYALDVATGTLVWRFKTGHRVWATPLIEGGIAYVGAMDRHLYALNLADGELVWSFAAGGAFASQPTLHQGTLYIGGFDDQLYAIDAETGGLRWRFAGENWFWGAVTFNDGTVFGADVDGNVYALDAATGEEQWRQAVTGDKGRKAAVRAGVKLSEDASLLLVGSENGTLYALDTADGRKVWSNDSQGQLLSDLRVVAGVIYEPVSYGTFRIRALHVENGREIWAHPAETETD